MGFLNFIFGKATKLEHPFFGTMRFLADKKEPHKSYFECRRHFTPSGRTIEIGMDGEESGPTQTQIDFFKRIEAHYAEISNAIVPLVEGEFQNWMEGFKIANFQKEFEAVYLRLPRCEQQPVSWEIAFESEHDLNHTFTITMSGFDAKDILIDG